MGDKDQKCLFCGKPKSQTNKRFIGGGGAIICEDCIKASNDILTRLRKAEEEIAEDYGLDKDYVFINIAEYPRFDEMKTQVSVEGKLYPLTEISNIIGALSKARFNIPDISVYVPEEEKSKFTKLKLENYIDLPEIDREKFHGIHYDQIKLF